MIWIHILLFLWICFLYLIDSPVMLGGSLDYDVHVCRYFGLLQVFEGVTSKGVENLNSVQLFFSLHL